MAFNKKISCGYHFALHIKTDGSIVGWGEDSNSQITNIPAGTNYVEVACGNSHCVALKNDGSLVAWGEDTNGQVTNVPAGTTFTKIDSHERICLALKSDGSLSAWGDDANGTITNVPLDANYTDIACGKKYALALKTDGSIVGWGYDVEGQITNIPAGTNFTKIASGDYLCLALDDTGTVHVWGYDIHNIIANKPTGTGYVDIAGGDYFGVAYKSDGTIHSWGYDGAGESNAYPKSVTSTIELVAGRSFAIGLTSSNELFGWGYDAYSQITGIPPELRKYVVGNQVLTPETGWDRTDGNDSNIIYSGTWSAGSHASYYNSTYNHSGFNTDNKARFYVQGTKFRLIGFFHSQGPVNLNIKVDGTTYTYNVYSGLTQYQSILFESPTLSSGLHHITMWSDEGNTVIWDLDAIDVPTGDTITTGVLATADSGWARFDNTDSKISYTGVITEGTGITGSYNDTDWYSTNNDTVIRFRFYGTKVRIINTNNLNWSGDVQISVDGVTESYSCYDPTLRRSVLSYENSGLDVDYHDVVISNPNNAGYWGLDCIDIDDTGNLAITVGQQLLTPEAGWIRHDATKDIIGLLGSWAYLGSGDPNWYGGSYAHVYNNTTATAFFKFKGTQFRFLGMKHTQGTKSFKVIVDGVTYSDYTTQYHSSYLYTSISFELYDLADTVHEVQILSTDSSASYMLVDCFDINDGGTFYPAYGAYLPTPEVGWIRQNQKSYGGAFRLDGSWSFGTQHQASTNGSLGFTFYGTAFRYTEYIHSSRSDNIEVWIDGAYEGTFSVYSSIGDGVGAELIYSKYELAEGLHEVKFINKYTGDGGTIMAYYSGGIDILDTGYFGANVMDRLYLPQPTWQILDGGEALINKYGSWNIGSFGADELNYYANTYINFSGSPSGEIYFTFYGTKLRIIDVVQPYNAGTRDLVVTIDGVDYHTTQRGHLGTYQYHTLMFEKTNLTLGYHTVKMDSKDDPEYTGLDCIHIDDTGNLVATVGQQLLTPSSGMTRIDNTDSNIVYRGTWVEEINASYYGGSTHYTLSLGSVSFKFNGTGFRLYDIKAGNRSSDLRVYVDGVPKGSFSCNGTSPYTTIVYELFGLTSGDHIVTIINNTANVYALDCIDLEGGTVLLPITETLIGDQMDTVNAEAGWVRFESNDALVKKSSNWTDEVNAAHSGGSAYWADGWADMRFGFTGTKLRIIMYTLSSWSNDMIAIIDGKKYHFASSIDSQARTLVFEITGLTDTTHTCMVFNNTTSNRAQIDAFDIETGKTLVDTKMGEALTTEEVGWLRADDSIVSAISATTGSQVDYYKGTFIHSSDPMEELTFAFYGTDLRIMDIHNSDKANLVTVYIDDVAYYGSQRRSSLLRDSCFFEVLGLPEQKHVVKVTVDVENNPSLGYGIDAIDINDTGYFTHPYLTEVFTLNDIEVGQCIRAEYTANSVGVAGTFANIGTATKDFLPIVPTQTSDGSFYFICVATDSGKLLIADRCVQTLQWIQINTGKYIDGLVYDTNKLIRIPTAGICLDDNGSPTDQYTGVAGLCFPPSNEWDTYVVRKIEMGADNIWHWSSPTTFGKDRNLASNSIYAMIRGGATNDTLSYSNLNISYLGFRPVLEYHNDNVIWG